MAAQQLQPSDILQRRLDVLGVAQNVPLDSANTNKTYLIFNTGNIGYPAPSKRVYVAYVVIDFSAGAPAAGVVAQFGLSGGLDWSGYGYSLDSATIGFTPPYTISPTAATFPNYNPPVYPSRLAFTVHITSITTPVLTLATFTAVGWCE